MTRAISNKGAHAGELTGQFLKRNELFRDLTGLDLNFYSSSRPVDPLHDFFPNAEILLQLRETSPFQDAMALAGRHAETGEITTLQYPLGLSATVFPLKSAKGKVLDFHVRLEGYLLDTAPTFLSETELLTLSLEGFKLTDERVFEMHKQTPILSWKKVNRLTAEIEGIAREIALWIEEQEGSGDNANHTGIRRAITFIEANLDLELDLESVARHSGMSYYHFSRIFHEETGESFSRFISRERCKKARNHLVEGKLRISEIAFKCGFQSLSQFNRAFATVFGKNPTMLAQELKTAKKSGFSSANSG